MLIAKDSTHLVNVYYILSKMCEVYWIAVTVFMILQIPDICHDHSVRAGRPGARRHRAAGDQHLTDQELQTLPPQTLELDLPLSTVAVERTVTATTAAARFCADRTDQLQAIAVRKKTGAQPVSYITGGMSEVWSANICNACHPADTLPNDVRSGSSGGWRRLIPFVRILRPYRKYVESKVKKCFLTY